jgi:hypothetical protein
MHDEILPSLVAEGDILLLKPFLDLHFDRTHSCTVLLGHFGHPQVLQTEKTSLRLDYFHLTAVSRLKYRNGFTSRMSPSATRGLVNLIIHYGRCMNKFGDCAETQKTTVQTHPYAFLVSNYFHSPKKYRNLFLTYPDNFWAGINYHTD